MNPTKSEYPIVVDLLGESEKQIVLCVPNISDELAEALKLIKEQKKIDIQIFLDFSEKSFRSGFGDISSIEKLEESNISVQDLGQYKVYCMLIDDKGYFYFPHSRFYEKEGSSIDMYPMTHKQVKEVKVLLNVLDENDMDFIPIIKELGEEKVVEIRECIQPISEEAKNEVVQKIKSNPPLKPNLKRKLNVYQAKYQFVELHFKGANLHIQRVQIPPNALPFRNETLNRAIEANLRLFTDIPEKEFLEPFFNLKLELDVVRKDYLYHLKARKKNIIETKEKAGFEEVISEIKNRIDDVRKDLLNELQTEINKTKQALKQRLAEFVKENPPEELEGLTGNNLEIAIHSETQKILQRIHFPYAKSILRKMEISYRFYDITWEDLNDEEVRFELSKANLIGKDDELYMSSEAYKAVKE